MVVDRINIFSQPLRQIGQIRIRPLLISAILCQRRLEALSSGSRPLPRDRVGGADKTVGYTFELVVRAVVALFEGSEFGEVGAGAGFDVGGGGDIVDGVGWGWRGDGEEGEEENDEGLGEVHFDGLRYENGEVFFGLLVDVLAGCDDDDDDDDEKKDTHRGRQETLIYPFYLRQGTSQLHSLTSRQKSGGEAITTCKPQTDIMPVNHVVRG
ncbi:hypothetical protein V494_07753 [Pseudogymnoascus sp. VKM F-4513 (FW-928)]|nr:hypothetical protein V494_07753 [Pseudogymnoascus sp. VKM F-4513 (FW-928)]